MLKFSRKLIIGLKNIEFIPFLFALSALVLVFPVMADQNIPWPSEKVLIPILQSGVKERKAIQEAITIRSMHRMNISKNEHAFLVSVWFPDRGRNFSTGTFLYRPSIQQARELNYSQSLGVSYVTRYSGADLLILESYGSGQGTEEFLRVLGRFDGWQFQVMHQASFGNNLGNCGAKTTDFRECEKTSIHFQLLPVGLSKQLELIELTTRIFGESTPSEEVSVGTRRLRLLDSRFQPF
jgi:hypothetical protein